MRIERILGICVAAVFAASASFSCSDDAPACCPRDEALDSCMRLGGENRYGCSEVCDFWCSTNWRVERDEAGCEVWKYDHVRRGPGEDSMCMPASGGRPGSGGAGLGGTPSAGGASGGDTGGTSATGGGSEPDASSSTGAQSTDSGGVLTDASPDAPADDGGGASH